MKTDIFPVRQTLDLGGKLIDLSAPTVMAIVNVTPDSFFAGSRNTSEAEVRRCVETALSEGAGILDVGGYSSRPGAAEVSPHEEFERAALGLRIVREIDRDIPVSIDTFRAEVVERIVEAFGPVIVNDISAGVLDPRMIPAVARLRLPYIAMHMRGTPATMQQCTGYDDVAAEVLRYFSRKVDEWTAAGIDDLVIDPGFGFAKTVEQNFELLGRLSDLRIVGRPVLAGVSRKTMIWKTLGVTPSDALTGTTALHWECLRQGAAILRVHDVREAVEVIKLYDAFRQAKGEKK